jgi:hypothetical protein
MKMNAGAWIGMIGGAIGILVAVISVLLVGGSSGIYIALGIVCFAGGMFYLFYKILFAPMILASRLQKTGIPGKAVIKEVHDTGVTVNNSPQIKLVLEVKNSFGQVYSTTIRTLISRLQPQMYQPGMTIPVLIDPNDENKLVIDYSGNIQSASTKSAGNINLGFTPDELLKQQKEEDAIRLTGTPARAIIKKYTWLGIYINGNNPYAEMEIEVLPDDAPAFKAKVKGAISEQSVPKYQPGQEIFVKYDPLDQTKVAIDHS